MRVVASAGSIRLDYAAGGQSRKRKYACFLTGNYQFVDNDIVFLRNPQEVLQPLSEFVASCVRWRDPEDARTPQSEGDLPAALDQLAEGGVQSGAGLRATGRCSPTLPRCTTPSMHRSTWRRVYHPAGEGPGANLLRLLSGVELTSLTLPPHHMESSWAGDYPDEGFEAHWSEGRRPYLIHWEGVSMRTARPIHELFYRHLTRPSVTSGTRSCRGTGRTGRAACNHICNAPNAGRCACGMLWWTAERRRPPTAMTASDPDQMPARYVVGIDLGTTNSAVAFVDTEASGAESARMFRVPQLVAPARSRRSTRCRRFTMNRLRVSSKPGRCVCVERT